jgi:hypothetical protein
VRSSDLHVHLLVNTFRTVKILRGSVVVNVSVASHKIKATKYGEISDHLSSFT